MTTTALNIAIGKIAQLRVETTLVVNVTVLDAKSAYGRANYLVRPISGEGEQWVSGERLIISL